jgi:hypothetical protein
MRYITIAGTGGAHRPEDWDSPDSSFSRFLSEYGCDQLVASPLKRYMWSTMVDGLDNRNDTWDAAGRALAHYICPPLIEDCLMKPEDTFIIAHSHGGNVVAYACGKYGLQVKGLVTIGTPIRKDMYEIYEAASDNIDRHLHLHGGWKDYWQVLGALFDGRFGIHRDHPCARNEKAPGGHGTILRDPATFHCWLDKGWLDFWVGK